VNAAAPWLSQPFVEEDFNFRACACKAQRNYAALEALRVGHGSPARGSARRSTSKIFSAKAKARAQEIVGHLIDALRDDSQTLRGWGRRRASRRSQNFYVCAQDRLPGQMARLFLLQGRPNFLRIESMRGSEFAFKRDLNKIGSPSTERNGI